jgi:hypothetical protein
MGNLSFLARESSPYFGYYLVPWGGGGARVPIPCLLEIQVKHGLSGL